MSFILDALRKSDARRQRTHAPGLNSPDPAPAPRRGRPRRWLAAIAALIVIAALAAYILVPDRPAVQLAGDGQSPPVPAQQPAAGHESVADREAAERPDDAASQAPAQRDPQLADQQPETAGAADGMAPAQPEPAPVQDRRQPIPASPERTVRRQAQPRESAPVPAAEASARLERLAAAEAQQRRARRQPAADAAPQPAPESAQEPERAPRPLSEGVAEYVRQWELPLAVRRSLPELNLSIHVFSPNEDERFVLINGERYTAGQSIGEARIVDIRRDGAIIDFRSSRFLLEPR